MKQEIDWLDIECANGLSKMHQHILSTYGEVSEQDWKICWITIDKYFRTWDNRVAPECNNDTQYAPCVFVWYAKNILKVESNVPIKIMRAIYLNLKEII